MSALEPRFRPDFAACVLAEADAAIARRREVRRAVTAAAAVSLVLIGTISWASLTGRPSEVRRRPETGSVAAAISLPSSGEQTDALAYMFPDAAPVARFATEYSDATDNGSADRDMLAALDAGTP
jgi:hypothetical protein